MAGWGRVFISNMAGAPGGPNARDGDGWISAMKVDTATGAVVEAPQVFISSGQHCTRSSPRPAEEDRPLGCLDSPKGLRHHGNLLWTADLDRLVGIDLRQRRIIHDIKVPGAIGLNDVAVDRFGNVFVSDIVKGVVSILRKRTGRPEKFIDSPRPNGLLVQGNNLYVLQWGVGEQDPQDFSTPEPGRLFHVTLRYGGGLGPQPGQRTEIKLHGKQGVQFPAKRNYDGFELFGDGALITNFTGTALEVLGGTVRQNNEAHAWVNHVLPLGEGGAGDLTVIPQANLVIVPLSFGKKDPRRSDLPPGVIIGFKVPR